MASETFSVVALPFSCDERAPFHVSLFVAPKLVPDDENRILRSFGVFRDWAEALLADTTTFALADDDGPIAVVPQLGDVDARLWRAVFPPGTPVRSADVPDWQSRHWRTFPAAAVHDAAKLLHLLSVYDSQTSHPAPEHHPLTMVLGEMGGLSDPDTWGSSDRDRREKEQPRYDESRITWTLDRLLGEGRDVKRQNLAEVERRRERNVIMKMITDLHRLRRFYERPESAQEYQDRPSKGAKAAPLPVPTPDFHERCALVGEHRELLRRLGLVVDLIVPDANRLRDSAWLSATIAPAGDDGPCRTTRTACEDAGDDLVSVPSTTAWRQGRLRIGDGDLFSVLDVEPDASGLKYERFLWTLPRLLLAKHNGDPVHAAPPALRSNGFTIVRNLRALGALERLGHQQDLAKQLSSNKQPKLHTEDVTRGMRVEVWDATAKSWQSLHTRRIDVEVDGQVVLPDVLDEGFIQGTAATETAGADNSPIHVHEALFGWEGWSLSAPKPGKRVRHSKGKELVEEADKPPAKAVTPVTVRTRVEPGTLPRLRYGRSYAFRVWAVDLAGNARPHDLGKQAEPGSDLVDAISSAGATIPPMPAVTKLLHPLRRETIERRTRPTFDRLIESLQPVTEGRDALDEIREVAGNAVHDAVVSRVAGRGRLAGRARGHQAGRAAIVEQSFASVLNDYDQEIATASLPSHPRLIAEAIAADVGNATTEPSLNLDLLASISALRPFLRWDPVQPPALVSRWRYTAGESLRQVVIRSGVTQDLTTLAITVAPPDDYAAASGRLGYHPTSERHLAPPKSSVTQAELHGCFDYAIGTTSATNHGRSLAIAVREDGTLFDVEVPKLSDPNKATPQPGIALLAPAGKKPKSLPLDPGEAPPSGQYIVHDTKQLTLPYLPDPIARGISLVFPEAGSDRVLDYPFATEGFTARFTGDWPEMVPFRMVLEQSDELSGRLDGSVLRIGLPAGDIQRFRLSSSLDRDDLRLLGLWNSLPEVLRNNDDVAEAVADGWLWAFTPYEDVTLVHAVPRPLEAPRPTPLRPRRGEARTDCQLIGAVDVHGPSTDSITAEATWKEPVDDLNLPVLETRENRSIAFTTKIRDSEDLALLGWADMALTLPDGRQVWMHENIHKFPDTKHRLVNYRFRATTRFREYFEPGELAPAPPNPAAKFGDPVDDGQSVVGPMAAVSIPSSAPPAAPIVHAVLPLFRWDDGTEPEQPVAYRRRRRAGVRIYLERPWFSSGDGELLAVLLTPRGRDEGLEKWVSQWGGDPVWKTTVIEKRALDQLALQNFLLAAGVDDRPGDAQPVVKPALLPLSSVPGQPTVLALGYKPQYNAQRELWYVDIAVEAGDTFWPFVRLSVARYQPESLDGCHLSPPVKCDYVQLTPERTASVARTDSRHVRVVVSGPVGIRFPRIGDSEIKRLAVTENRRMVASLQERDPAIPTDLGWTTVDARELTIRGEGPAEWDVSWVGALVAPDDIPLATPGSNDEWRVVVEEWERLPGDPASLAEGDDETPIWEERLVYADEFFL